MVSSLRARVPVLPPAISRDSIAASIGSPLCRPYGRYARQKRSLAPTCGAASLSYLLTFLPSYLHSVFVEKANVVVVR